MIKFLLILVSLISFSVCKQDCFNGEWCKLVPISLEELCLELDPVKSESVQEALHHVHAH